MGCIGGAAQAGPQRRARLKKLATQLGIQREALPRRSAVIDRGLHALMPSTQKTNYAAAGRASVYRDLHPETRVGALNERLPVAAFFVARAGRLCALGV